MSRDPRAARAAFLFGLSTATMILVATTARDAQRTQKERVRRTTAAHVSSDSGRILQARTGSAADSLREPPAAAVVGAGSQRPSPFFPDVLMVAPAKGRSLAAVARHLGGTVERAPGRSGYGLVRLPAGMDADPALDGAALTIHWTPHNEDRILERLAGAYTAMSTGTGLASCPMGIVFNEVAVDAFASVDTINVDLDGTGLASSPMGILTMDRLTFDGTGLASSPMGLLGLRLAAFDGSGLASSPLGLTAWHMVMTIDALDGTGLASSPMGFDLPLRPVMVDLDGTGPASSPMGLQDLSGTHLGQLRSGAGTITGTGHPVAEAIRASGVGGVEPQQLVVDPVGQGVTEADPDEILE